MILTFSRRSDSSIRQRAHSHRRSPTLGSTQHVPAHYHRSPSAFPCNAAETAVKILLLQRRWKGKGLPGFSRITNFYVKTYLDRKPSHYHGFLHKYTLWLPNLENKCCMEMLGKKFVSFELHWLSILGFSVSPLLLELFTVNTLPWGTCAFHFSVMNLNHYWVLKTTD